MGGGEDADGEGPLAAAEEAWADEPVDVVIVVRGQGAVTTLPADEAEVADDSESDEDASGSE